MPVSRPRPQRGDFPPGTQRYGQSHLGAPLLLAQEAERLGFARMLGCMLCTSRAISAALPLAPLARFADLDGPTWLAVDVEPALHFSTGVLHL